MQTVHDLMNLPWTTVVIALTLAAMTYVYVFITRMGRRKGRRPPASPGLDRSGALASSLLILLAVLLMNLLRKPETPSAESPPDLTAVSHQWWWELRYEHLGVVTANEIHLPIGESWRVCLQSASGRHEFWMPRLGLRLPLVAGEPTCVQLELEQEGSYVGSCSEACRQEHPRMDLRIVAETPDHFEAWRNLQLRGPAMPTSDEAVYGAQLFQQLTCHNCHSIGGGAAISGKAPDLTHFASRTTLGAGLFPNTPSALTRWLSDARQIKAGDHMPDLQLTGRDIRALVAYMDHLK